MDENEITGQRGLVNKQKGLVNKWWTSSVNPEDLSLTIKGFLVSVAPLAIMVLHFTGHDISQTNVDEIIAQIVGIIAGIMTVWGLIRKFAVFMGTELE